MVKFVYAIDYPVGHKSEYLDWVKSIKSAIQSPDEIRRVAAYDNYYGGTPHRIVEFEFDDMEAATKYWARPELRDVIEQLVGKGANNQVQVYELRGDYTKQ